MKKIIILITYISLCFNIYGADITNKQQADKFIANYCIELVNGISNTKRRAETKIKNNNMKGFLEESSWIAGLADVYSKLCK